MRSIVELTVGSEEFALRRALRADGGVTIRAETDADTNQSVPYIWMEGAAREWFETAAERGPSVERLERRLAERRATLYEVDWSASVEPVFDSLAAADALLAGVGNEESWRFTLRVTDQERIPAVRERCREHGCSATIERTYAATGAAGARFGLTQKQQDALLTALEQGYFEVPRDATQSELADALGIESSATSEALRRATAALVENTLAEQETEE